MMHTSKNIRGKGADRQRRRRSQELRIYQRTPDQWFEHDTVAGGTILGSGVLFGSWSANYQAEAYSMGQDFSLESSLVLLLIIPEVHRYNINRSA